MLRSFYESEKRNKTIYDGVHEYCLAEKMNEELFRASIKKEVSADKFINTYGTTSCLSALLVALGRIIHLVR